MPRKRVQKPKTEEQVLDTPEEIEQEEPLSKNQSDQQFKSSALCLERARLMMGGKNNGKDVERSIFNSRYFYHFAMYSNKWTLFVFDSFHQQSFGMYNASAVKKQFSNLSFQFVAYDLNYGLVYDDEKILKVQLDHEAKVLRSTGEVFDSLYDSRYNTFFKVHTVEIMRNDIVFVYVYANNKKQRVYLQKWSNLAEENKMCKIGVLDALAFIQFVSGQFLDEHRLCTVHMQDKSREFGLITPWVFIWNTEGEKFPEKFEKVELKDGQPFFKELGTKNLRNKICTGAWHSHLFTLVISQLLPKSKTLTTMFIFNAFSKIWSPLTLPSNVKSSRSPLISFFNSGIGDDSILNFCSKTGTLPTVLYQMAVIRPQPLRKLAWFATANKMKNEKKDDPYEAATDYLPLNSDLRSPWFKDTDYDSESNEEQSQSEPKINQDLIRILKASKSIQSQIKSVDDVPEKRHKSE